MILFFEDVRETRTTVQHHSAFLAHVGSGLPPSCSESWPSGPGSVRFNEVQERSSKARIPGLPVPSPVHSSSGPGGNALCFPLRHKIISCRQSNLAQSVAYEQGCETCGAESGSIKAADRQLRADGMQGGERASSEPR